MKPSDKLNDNSKKLAEVEAKISSCENCPLYKTRTRVVPGSGSPVADIMFVGEAPGANEDATGIPFCGAAGKFLDQMLLAIGLSRDDVFIANTLKCRPPENRDPEDIEKTACRPFLEEQFKIINPKIIVCLGRHSLATFLPAAGGISKTHGKPFKKKNGQVFLPLYHPAAALHNGSLRNTLIEDFNKIPKIIKKLKEEEYEEESSDDLKQLKLI